MLEAEDPAYDPRLQVNMEASKLYWGTKEEKREYSKRFRRYVYVEGGVGFALGKMKD